MPERASVKIIGLCGYARCGKDSLASFLSVEHGYQRIAFADKLRDMLYALNPLIGAGFEEADGYTWTTRVQDLVDNVGWDRAKEGYPEIRALLQRLGTEAGRTVLGENVWVDASLRDLDPAGRYVVTDVRFPNEFAAIEERGGVMVRVLRPGYEPVNGHSSETALDDVDCDYVFRNNAGLNQMRAAADRIVAAYEESFHGV